MRLLQCDYLNKNNKNMQDKLFLDRNKIRATNNIYIFAYTDELCKKYVAVL